MTMVRMQRIHRLRGAIVWLLALGALGLGAGRHSLAQEIQYKAVYRDKSFFTNWDTPALADIVTAYFQAAGYDVLDEAHLRPWLDARIQDRARSVLINSHDTLPDSALDPVPGANGKGLFPSANNPVRRYLLSGGRMINWGDIPFYLHATANIRAEDGWQGGGGTVILGRPTVDPDSSQWGVGDKPVITADGTAWGLTQIHASVRPARTQDVDVVLATNKKGQPAAYIQSFTNIPGRGEFVRIIDNQLDAKTLTTADLDDMKRLAEYDPSGTVSTPLDTGLEGSIDLAGVPLVAQNVPIRDAMGHQVALAATDTNGHYFAYLQPGTYTLDPSTLVVGGVPPQAVTVEAGKVTTAQPFDLINLPTIGLTQENGFQWLAYLNPAVDPKASYAAPTADETSFVPFNVTAKAGNWSTLLTAAMITNAPMHGWLRLHIKLPADWSAKYRGDLRLHDFNFKEVDQTFFNGTAIGKTGQFPEDPMGLVKAGTVLRDYTIPAALVNWDGDNVLAIHGYHNGGAGAFTTNRPQLTATAVTAVVPGGSGDINGDGKVDIKDATLSLAYAVGIQTPTDAEKAAGDINGDGQLDIKDTTLVLKKAVGG